MQWRGRIAEMRPAGRLRDRPVNSSPIYRDHKPIDSTAFKSHDLNMAPKAVTSSSREQTRAQLITAAEKLFAESGIDGVSLRQINVEAGQKNSSAAHYHFGSKETLILAVYQIRIASVNQRRLETLQQIEAAGKQNDVRSLVEAIVHPIVEEIDADKSGRYYIRFMAQAMGHPQLDLNKLWQQEHSEGFAKTLTLLRAALPYVPDPVFGQRFGLSFEQIVHSLADRERLRSTARKNFAVNAALFVSNLVDCIAGAMATPISSTTQAELDRIALNAS
jgi:AcrR family transcriptional regulator